MYLHTCIYTPNTHTLINAHYSAIILYDRPPGRFKPTTVQRRHKVLCCTMLYDSHLGRNTKYAYLTVYSCLKAWQRLNQHSEQKLTVTGKGCYSGTPLP